VLDEKSLAAKLANADTNTQNGCTQNVSSIASGNHSVNHICCSCDVDDQEARKAAPDFLGIYNSRDSSPGLAFSQMQGFYL
jgi:hypothetical protein